MYDVGNDYADVSTKITEILKSPDTFDKNEEVSCLTRLLLYNYNSVKS